MDFKIHLVHDITPSFTLDFAERELPGLGDALALDWDDEGLVVTGRLPRKGYYRFMLEAVHDEHQRYETVLNVLLEYLEDVDPFSSDQSDEDEGSSYDES